MLLAAVRRKSREGGNDFVAFQFFFCDIPCNELITEQLIKTKQHAEYCD